MLLMSKGSKVVFVAFTQHCIQSNVTHLTHVERVESVLGIKWPLAPPKYAVRVHNIFTHNFLNIQWNFNPKKVLEAETETFPTIPSSAMYVKGVESRNNFDPFDIHSIGWYGWKGLSLSFPKPFWIENPFNIKKVMSKTVKASFYPFDMSNMSNN